MALASPLLDQLWLVDRSLVFSRRHCLDVGMEVALALDVGKVGCVGHGRSVLD